jgi:UDP-3-O-[3-hydroxymyristoyl] glucosamine N-acyltransferase
MKFTGQNVRVSPKAKIGANVRIGDNTVVYDNVVIGDNSTICNDCVLGEPLAQYYYESNYENPELVIGKNSLIRSHTILYAGSTIGESLQTGHRVTIREHMKIGAHCMIGTLCDVMGFSSIGDYTRLYNNVHVCQFAAIGQFVFIYPYTIFTNDPHPPSNTYKGATVGDYTQIAVHTVFLPRVNVGSNCLIGANTTITQDFGNGLLIMGTPAKSFGSIEKIQSVEKPGTSHYPWMYNFERGMPWAGIGYEKWLETQPHA